MRARRAPYEGRFKQNPLRPASNGSSGKPVSSFLRVVEVAQILLLLFIAGIKRTRPEPPAPMAQGRKS